MKKKKRIEIPILPVILILIILIIIIRLCIRPAIATNTNNELKDEQIELTKVDENNFTQMDSNIEQYFETPVIQEELEETEEIEEEIEEEEVIEEAEQVVYEVPVQQEYVQAEQQVETRPTPSPVYHKTSKGTVYYTIGQINIPKVSINYPIISETSEKLMKIGITKYWGCNPNEVGNMCVVGHNYRNDGKFFSKLHYVTNGDIIYVTDLYGDTLTYVVYNTMVVDPYDTNCTSQLTDGRKDITLITCYNKGTQRYVVKATAQ